MHSLFVYNFECPFPSSPISFYAFLFLLIIDLISLYPASLVGLSGGMTFEMKAQFVSGGPLLRRPPCTPHDVHHCSVELSTRVDTSCINRVWLGSIKDKQSQTLVKEVKMDFMKH